jgi:NAD(P)-dependent dehydrogenase (short-subunit alcohol dehydrogenase family)
VLFNAWDAGSAKAVAAGGAKGIATSSWSVAAANGFVDGERIPLDLAMNNLRGIVSAVEVGECAQRHDDPSSEFAAFSFIGYGASKAALNMLTVQLAAELKDSGIKVNSADPAYTATDLNGRRGRRTIPDGAAGAICLALLPDDGPS